MISVGSAEKNVSGSDCSVGGGFAGCMRHLLVRLRFLVWMEGMMDGDETGRSWEGGKCQNKEQTCAGRCAAPRRETRG